MAETPHARPQRVHAGGPLRLAALCLTALVVTYRPLASGAVGEHARLALFALALLAAALLWAADRWLRGGPALRLPPATFLFAAFLAAGLVSSLRAQDTFAGLEWCCLMATYGLAAFLALQLGLRPAQRRFLGACLIATGAALAGYAVWHYALYVPALRRWLAAEPDLVQAVTGAGDALARDLRDRVMADRAYGNFLTPNQLAAFLVLALFPLVDRLAAWCRARATPQEASPHALAGVALAAGAALAVAALYLTRSKGGWLCFLFAAALYAAPALWRLARLRFWKGLAAVLAALALFAALGVGTGAVPPPGRFARSLGVRLDYWRTSAAIARRRPVLGVGPGAWDEWYAMLKRPEFEETRAPHSAHLRLWAETGTVGLALWAVLWVAALAGPVRRARSTLIRRGLAATPPVDRRLLAAGLAVAGAALALDYALVGTLWPPRFVPAWLEAAPWLPYLLVYGLWAAAFAGAILTPGPTAAWAFVAALAGFLLHSAAEVTLTVPAVAGTAAVVVGLLLAADEAPRRRGVRLSKRGWAAAVLLLTAATLAWGAAVTPRVLRASAQAERARTLRAELLARRDGAELPRAGREVEAGLEAACRAVPWNAETWRELGEWRLRMSEAGLDGGRLAGALDALERAVQLNPLDAGAHAVVGRALGAADRPQAAVRAYRRAAEMRPSLPRAWYDYARAAARAGAPPEAVHTAYRRALKLMPRQRHERNRVLGPPEELVALWREVTDEPLPGSLLELAVQMGRRGGGPQLPEEAPERRKLALVTEGLPEAAGLAGRWDALSEQERNHALWQAAAGRLWQWALRARLASGQ